MTIYRRRVDNFPSDPDLRHLADLLDFLPGPDDREFWATVDGKGHTPVEGHHVDYVIKNLKTFIPALHDPEPSRSNIEYLAKYLMMFFGGDHPGLHQFLSHHILQLDLPPGMIGRLWVEDLIATCWRLHVRYSAKSSSATKWPARKGGE